MCNKIHNPKDHIAVLGEHERHKDDSSAKIRAWWPGSEFKCLGKFKEEKHEDYVDLGVAMAVGTPCNKRSDTCGDKNSMCCGIATGGKNMDANGEADDCAAPNLIICNKKPGVIGEAHDYTNRLPDGSSSLYPGSSFKCLADLKIPSVEEHEEANTREVNEVTDDDSSQDAAAAPEAGSSSGLKVPMLGDPMTDGTHNFVGDLCSQKAGNFSCGDSESWCCGIATHGDLNYFDAASGDMVLTGKAAPNLVICNVIPNVNGKGALRFNATYVNPLN